MDNNIKLFYPKTITQRPLFRSIPNLNKQSMSQQIIQLSYNQYNNFKMSNNQDITPNMLVAQKSVVEQKQTNSIRKVTIESLTPIITKVQEHIHYLMQQTTNLKKQTGVLMAATTNQRSLQVKIKEAYESTQKLSMKIIEINKDKDIKFKQKDKQLRRMSEEIQKLKKENESQGKQIVQISKSNDDYLVRIDHNKEEQLVCIDKLKDNIEKYYQDQMAKIGSIQDQFNNLMKKVGVIQDRRKIDQQQIKQIAHITNLYSYERNEIKKVIDKANYLETNVVYLNDYEKDKRLQQISNHQLKEDIRVMLDEALTPQIRIFLPKLITKLDQLNKFQNTLDQISAKFEQTRVVQQQKLSKLSQTWQNKFKTSQQNIEQDMDEVNSRINKFYGELDERILLNQQKVGLRFKVVQDLEKMLVVQEAKGKDQLEHSISDLEKSLKEYLNVWGEQFLDRKKDNIFQIVQTQKPPEMHKQQQKVQELVFSMQPLLNQVKNELQLAQHQLQSSKQTLSERLTFFSNQIVKMKSDITTYSSDTRRVLQGFNFKLNQSRNTCDQLSLLISKLTQTTIISYALSIDQGFLHREHEVYVTYNDGILFQISQNGNLLFRRKQFIPEMLKRAVLTEMVKIIDDSILTKPLLGWNKNEFKPSHLFHSIQSSYQTLCQQNKMSLQQKTAKITPYGQRKSFDKKIKKQMIPAQNISKQIVNKDIFSQTISHDSTDLKGFKTTRYDADIEQNRQYSSRRKNIKLKKIDKKQ